MKKVGIIETGCHSWYHARHLRHWKMRKLVAFAVVLQIALRESEAQIWIKKPIQMFQAFWSHPDLDVVLHFARQVVGIWKRL